MILQKYQNTTLTGIFSHVSFWGLAQMHLILIESVTYKIVYIHYDIFLMLIPNMDAIGNSDIF